MALACLQVAQFCVCYQLYYGGCSIVSYMGDSCLFQQLVGLCDGFCVRGVEYGRLLCIYYHTGLQELGRVADLCCPQPKAGLLMRIYIGSYCTCNPRTGTLVTAWCLSVLQQHCVHPTSMDIQLITHAGDLCAVWLMSIPHSG